MSFKNFLSNLLVKFFSKFNKSQEKDFLDILEKLIIFAKGKHRGFYDLKFEIIQISKIAKSIEVKNIVDIGAHKGFYSQILLEKYPNANYYLFEPQKNLYNMLIEKFNKKNFHIFNFGLSDENKELDFFQTKNDDGLGSIYKRQTEYIDKKKKFLIYTQKYKLRNFKI